ncbi:hypothetical protein [Streptomyces sp. XD-27]|uniref:hypothetical protein n=1 Tax=Streptomyces sp. XD-27 TaxID=3062779 RepID=UPI0026F44B31|nr:hypothetical protein [Streptomyces sp. XD-27]WKX70320.1 hypothetical protein Q3Y56_10660 [Streptomyces sp. XD-27]
MSYNQPPPQPGPYGGGQPNPYGGAQQPPADTPNPYAQPQQPGYGYPQQAPQQPGYGYPQQQPAQPGYGYPQAQSGGYPQPGQPGQPPVPPATPGGRKDRTKVIAIASAGVVVVGAIVVGAVFLTGGGEEDVKAMKLETPKELGKGTYKRDKGTEELKKDGKSVQGSLPEGATSVLATYKHADDENSSLSFSGVYGEFSDPEKVQDQMFKAYTGADKNAKVEKQPKAYPPNGSDGPSLKCAVVKMYGEYYAPVCTWAEKSDAAMVLDLNADHIDVTDVDVDAFAKVVAGIYKETRKPA